MFRQPSTVVFDLFTSPGQGQWFAAWLYRLASGFASGADLIEAVPPGKNVDGATLDHLLLGAESAGWIKRTGLAPSPSQKFFGIASVRPVLWPEYAPPVWYGWQPGPRFAEAWRFAERSRESANDNGKALDRESQSSRA